MAPKDRHVAGSSAQPPKQRRGFDEVQVEPTPLPDEESERGVAVDPGPDVSGRDWDVESPGDEAERQRIDPGVGVTDERGTGELEESE